MPAETEVTSKPKQASPTKPEGAEPANSAGDEKPVAPEDTPPEKPNALGDTSPTNADAAAKEPGPPIAAPVAQGDATPKATDMPKKLDAQELAAPGRPKREIISGSRITGDPEYITRMFADSIAKARAPSPEARVSPPKRPRLLETPPIAQQFLQGIKPRVENTNASVGGTSFRRMLDVAETAPGKLKQRFKAVIQPTIIRDDHPHAPFTPTFTPSQMREYVRTFQPVPLLIEHEKWNPSIGTLERVWLEGPESEPRLCGQIYFHMENEDSRAALRTVHRLGGTSLSLGCSHEYDSSWRKLRTRVHEISVVTTGMLEDACFMHTNASAWDFDRGLCLPLGGKCYIDETLAF